MPTTSRTTAASEAQPVLYDRAANYAAISPLFVQKFGRLPVSPDHPDALINDLIFLRMIEPEWPASTRAFVDKATAKDAARAICPALRAPETLALIPMEEVASPSALYDRVAPFAGMDAVAKPTHASGSAVFLRDLAHAGQLAELHELASRDYASVVREMQYAGLPRQVIVEALVPTTDGLLPDDCKFHCINGVPLLCQIDHARFGEAWSRVFTVPDFAPLDPDDGMVAPPGLMFPTPERLAEMAAAAAALSAPFDYVRVDLYNGADGIYFGELTFTPAASLGIAPSAAGCAHVTPTHRRYSDTLMSALR